MFGSTSQGFQVFQLCDEGNKGYLSREDLKVAVVMLFGYKPSKLEVDSMLSSFMINTTGVTSDNFLKMMALKKAAQLSFGNQREIFSVFDVHCRGFLTLEDFKRAFRQVAPHLSERTVVEAFREVDQDSDGLVSYKDFEFVLNYGEDDQ
uniref:EF-hand calcium binding domain 11 n=1 Tax=Xenopus tropicalis TaxID=8364 RepID=A0A803J684_XENTR